MKIAVDAMGGDHAPQAVVEGAVRAAATGIELILVGRQEKIRPFLPSRLDGLPVEVRHAAEVVEMGESPAKAVRRKRDSSLVVAAELVKSGEAAAMVTAGSTGAGMAASLFTFGRIPGIDRPAIAALLPNIRGFTVLLDAGADRDVEPPSFVQYGVMGAIYARELLGVKDPVVGLMNVGHEEGKGNVQVRQAYDLMKEAPIHFAGNIEGPDLFNGKIDVAVCDGFTGNVVLKVGEGAAEFVRGLIREELGRNPFRKIQALALRPAFASIRRRTDYGEKGGAPLLGVNGICIICHGRSAPFAIANGIRTAAEAAKHGIISKISEQLAPPPAD